jgi:signal transduction histidine kinase
MQERLNAPGCRFEVQVEENLPRFMADPDALVTAILNLLDNAYKYSGDEKQIVLRSYREDGSVCFEVEDNGIGLSARDSKRVFRRFYQVDRSLSRSGSGVGLGLSIVQFVMAAHGGDVRVRSELGSGSKFTLLVPEAEALA